MSMAHVLIADITGSTKLYETLPQRDALERISIVLSGMREIVERHGGHCIKSQGDDTLNMFTKAADAFSAAHDMLVHDWPEGLGLHAGICWGEVLNHDSDIYGDAVNTAARLAALAKPGEVLLEGSHFDQLDAPVRSLCLPLGQLKLKGKRSATPVHAYAALGLDKQTVVFGKPAAQDLSRSRSVLLQCNGTRWTLREGDSLLVGRSRDCEVIMNHPWVSRQHGKFELRGGHLEFTDHSSSGSTIIALDGRHIPLHRDAMLLDREGTVLCGTQDPQIAGSIVQFCIDDLVAG